MQIPGRRAFAMTLAALAGFTMGRIVFDADSTNKGIHGAAVILLLIIAGKEMFNAD